MKIIIEINKDDLTVHTDIKDLEIEVLSDEDRGTEELRAKASALPYLYEIYWDKIDVTEKPGLIPFQPLPQ